MICVQLGGLQSQEIPLLWGKQDSILKIDCLTTSGVLLQKYLKALGGREINGQGWRRLRNRECYDIKTNGTTGMQMSIGSCFNPTNLCPLPE